MPGGSLPDESPEMLKARPAVTTRARLKRAQPANLIVIVMKSFAHARTSAPRIEARRRHRRGDARAEPLIGISARHPSPRDAMYRRVSTLIHHMPDCAMHARRAEGKLK